MPAWRQVEVALTILKLTETDRQTGRQAGRQAQVSIGRPAPPKITIIYSDEEEAEVSGLIYL